MFNETAIIVFPGLRFFFRCLPGKLKRLIVKKFLESNIVYANDFCFGVDIIMIHLVSSQTKFKKETNKVFLLLFRPVSVTG